MPNPNRDIERLIMSAQWEIEPTLGLAALNQYLSELDSGASIEELRYSERRQQQLPRVFDVNASQIGAQNRSSITQGYTHPVVAVLKLEGVMRMNDGLSTRGIRQLTDDLYTAYGNEQIVGVLIETNSPGGDSIAGSVLQNAIVERNKPVVLYGHTIASAAYKGGMAADAIVMSSQDSRLGSIGTMTSINKRIVKFYLENYDDIYAEGSENKQGEFKAYMKGDKGPIVEKLTKVNRLFQAAVIHYRELDISNKDVQDALTGHMFTSQDAIDVGLADQIATFRQTIHAIFKTAETWQMSDIRGLPPSELFIQNQEQMSFSKNLITALNKIPGVKIGDSDSQEEIAKKINEATEQAENELFERLLQRMKQEEEGTDTEEEEEQEEEEEEEEEEESTADQLLNLQSIITGLQEDMKSLKKENQKLRLKIKSGKSETDEGLKNDNAVKVGSYQSVKAIMGAAKTGKGSKYSK